MLAFNERRSCRVNNKIEKKKQQMYIIINRLLSLLPVYSIKKITHADASASWYTPQSGVNVPQLRLTEATTDPKEMIWAALEGGTATKVDGFKCRPARPSKIGKAITLGIQTKFSNLSNFFFL